MEPVYNIFTITVHSKILEAALHLKDEKSGNVVRDLAAHNSVKLWYLAHFISQLEGGSGKATFSLHWAAAVLNTHVRTIKRYLNPETNKDFDALFRNVTRNGKSHVTVYVRSLQSLCKRWNIRDLGAIAEVPITDLAAHKLLATELEGQKLQEQSRRAAKKAAGFEPLPRDLIFATGDRVGSKELPSVEDNEPGQMAISAKQNEDDEVDQNQPLLYASRVKRILHRTPNRCFVAPNTKTYGGSQITLGDRTGRSRSTIKRRLSNAKRQKKGLEPINRTQIIMLLDNEQRDSIQVSGSFDKVEIYFKEGDRLMKGFERGEKKTVYVYRPNVYAFERELKNQRRLQQKVKNLFEEELALAS